MIPLGKRSSIVCSNNRAMAMLAVKEKRTACFSSFIARRFLWTHRLYCILSYILLLNIGVSVNWRMLSPFFFSLLFFGFEERKRDGVCSLVSKIVLLYVPYRLQERLHTYIDQSINTKKFNCFLDRIFVLGGGNPKCLLLA